MLTPHPEQPYKFFCRRCNRLETFAKKEDVLAAKREHKKQKCGLLFAPLPKEGKDYWVLTRKEIAEELREKYPETPEGRAHDVQSQEAPASK